ncbi:sulfatase-like hydrolase/transferase [Hazenella sp. IB182353]|uniref:sulfatase-like hydrolase/transferase n=1 Tax=Polycladospora coralii TaxID=2771432 RepID=UPI001BCD8BA0|nr:sulfatase-like hydrolase/transferase [Polycladospora coralii]
MKIIFIAIDTLRTDRLHCYGAPQKTISPNIDALAENGVLFENMFADNNVTQFTCNPYPYIKKRGLPSF